MKIGFFLLLLICFFSFSSINPKALANDLGSSEISYENSYEFSLEELEKGISLNEDIFLANDGFDYKMNNVIIGKNQYLICGEFESEQKYPTRFFTTFPYLAFYQNNSLKWKIKTDFYGHGKFISAVLLEDKIIAVGTFESELQVKQIGIFEISYNGDILNYHMTKGNDNSECENVYAYKEFYYVTGVTQATNLGYGNVENINHILVMIFNKDLENFDNLYLSNDQNGRLYQSFFGGNSIFLFGEINGDGYFDNEKSNKILMCVSERLDLDMYKTVNHNENSQIIAIKDEAMFFEYDTDPSKIKVTTYGFGLEEKKEQILNLAYNVYQIESFKAYYSIAEDKVIIGSTLKNNKTYYDLLAVLNNKLEVLYTIDVKKEDNSLLEFCSLLDGELFSFGTYQKNLYGRKVMNVKVVDNECYFNGIKGEKIVKQIEETIFGTYPQEINYCYQDYKIITYGSYRIELECTIKDGGIYQKGFALEFNGNAILNGETINSGYLINENGNYLLRIDGKDETVYFSFTVKDLSIEEQTVKTNNLIIKEESKKPLESTEVNYDSNIVNYQKQEITKLSFLFIGIGLILGIIIPFEKVGRKRA